MACHRGASIRGKGDCVEGSAVNSDHHSNDGGLIMINHRLGRVVMTNTQAWLAVRQQQDDFRAELRAIADQERRTGVVGNTTCEAPDVTSQLVLTNWMGP